MSDARFTSAGPWADRVGQFYSPGGAARILRIDETTLNDWIERGLVLAAQTEDDVLVLPAFQFEPGASRVRPGVARLLAVLNGTPRWGTTLWLVTASPDLGGASPQQAADDVLLLARAVQLAREYATSVSS